MKKIPTLFRRVYKEHRIVDIMPNITEGCEEAFLHGFATVKIDGSCCSIINGVFYKRYDAKAGKPIPNGAIPCQDEPDPVTGHFPCWVKCNRENKADKWLWAAYSFYMETKLVDSKLDGTYEAIGEHFNGNPYGLEYDILKKHGTSLIPNLTRTFEGVKNWLECNDEEGIVFWLNGEPICKIKRTDFGLEWPLRK